MDLFIGIYVSLIIVGVLLVAVEVFLIPGFGFAGLAGLILMLSGVYLAADTFAQGALYLIITFLATGLLIYVGVKTGRVKRLWGKIFLGEKQNVNAGFVAPKADYIKFLGKTGSALTLMRPAGSAIIDGERVDVVSEGSYIEKGASIKVIAVEGTRIIVRKEEI
ncbi:MAG: hypothetical protein APF84_16375 [Gracilibacter sp. BRH_c7a]|nr:MAG: hypothetical protein APF84_16375 [Gracilibacter sp. BRH_c7a]